ncbi:MAG: type IV secretory system conjugative DNA transfer family protein, partial [Methylococcales bacterium]|nr:type IV secretory system conjugative DNA transfer family protein [Methylococcales bacterium]
MARIPLSLRLARSLPKSLKRLFGLHTENHLHGEARWADKGDTDGLFHKSNQGLLIGKQRLSQNTSCQHLGVFAPTGQGKTTKIIIPNVLNCQGSLVVTDVSGEIYRATSGHLASRGFQIKVLNLADTSKSHFFNPFHRADTPQKRRQKISTIANSKAGASEQFWTDGAIRVLDIGLSALVGSGQADQVNCSRLRWIVNRLGVEDREVAQFIADHSDKNNFEAYEGLMNEDAKTRQGFISTAKTALDIWQDEAISQLTSQDSMELDTMRDQKTAYFVIVPEDQVTYFSTLINLFYQECFEQAKAPLRRSNERLAEKQAQLLKNEKIASHADYELLRRNKPKAYKRLVEKYQTLEKEAKNQRIEPLYFFLDEFGNLGKLDGFARTANTIRKYGCSLTVVLQAKSQLEATYGLTESQSIMEALVSKLYMAGMGL